MLNRYTLYFVIGATLLTACANNPIRSYKNESDRLLQTINSTHQVESVVFGNYKEPDILFFMEYGTYLRMVSNYTPSDWQFYQAQKIVDNWVFSWKNTTSGSITTTTTQMLFNDSITDYEPKGYEKTMLATYRALNHIGSNNWNNARVEIKKMYQTEQAIANYNQALYMKEEADSKKLLANQQQNQIYNSILQKYDFSDINDPQVLVLKNSYQNAFSHYLAGFVFEALNEPSLARPGYLKSGQLSPLSKLPTKSIDNLDSNNTTKPGYANVLIVQEIGHAPQLKSQEVHIPIPIPNRQQMCISYVNLFFPTLVPDKYNNHDISYIIDNIPQNQELFTNFDLMAARSLHDIMPHLIERNITAAVRNIAASTASCTNRNNGGTILNLTSIISGMIFDRADERTWVLLPRKIYLNRVQLPLGKHTFNITIHGRTYSRSLLINQPYQVVDMRIIGNKFFFNT